MSGGRLDALVGSVGHWVRFDGLGPRLAALLTVALLPLGIVSLGQTRDLASGAERRADLALLALTREAAEPLVQDVQRALGAAEALAGVATRAGPPPPGSCAAAFGGLAGPGSPYATMSFLRADGGRGCEAGAPMSPGVAALADAAAREPALRVEAAGAEVLVTMPFGPPEEPVGVVALALRRGPEPASAVAPPALAPPAAGPAERPLRLVVVNARGAVVEDRGSGDAGLAAGEPLPATVVRDSATAAAPLVLRAGEGSGGRIYAITPLVPGTLAAIGVWSPAQARGQAGPVPAAPVLFPLAMWLASLLVAGWAANSLVVRPVAGLGAVMRRFGADRSLPDGSVPADAPRELRDIDAAFREAATSILRDEARMEDAFRERGVLLREIHHRVKNNLQLISSIVSMQIRRAPDTRTRMILRRLQDRVLTLAAIYRSLYTSGDVSEASVAPILRAIVEQEVVAQPGRVSLSLDLEDIVLDADKSVPLAFLAAEAVSNATLQAAQAGPDRHVGVSLRRCGPEAVIEVVNALPPGGGADPAKGPGLGAHLIAAFTVQLGGRAVSGPRDGLYRLAVTFPLAGHEPAGGGEEESRLSA